MILSDVLNFTVPPLHAESSLLEHPVPPKVSLRHPLSQTRGNSRFSPSSRGCTSAASVAMPAHGLFTVSRFHFVLSVAPAPRAAPPCSAQMARRSSRAAAVPPSATRATRPFGCQRTWTVRLPHSRVELAHPRPLLSETALPCPPGSSCGTLRWRSVLDPAQPRHRASIRRRSATLSRRA